MVGVNKFTTTEPNPLTSDVEGSIMTVDPAVEQHAIEALQEWKAGRDAEQVAESLRALRDAAKTDENLMVATIACARAGVTTGEWAGALREVFGEYRAPTGVAGASASGRGRSSSSPTSASRSRRPAPSWAPGCASWSASPVWTGTPTAPSRSPYAPATWASRWSTRASA